MLPLKILPEGISLPSSTTEVAKMIRRLDKQTWCTGLYDLPLAQNVLLLKSGTFAYISQDVQSHFSK